MFIPALAAFCWAAGGTKGFHKALRRYVYPILAGLLLGIWGAEWWAAMLFSILSIIVFSLGYGDGRNWFQRGAVGLLYGLPLIPLGPFGLLAPPIMLAVFTGQMWLSMRWGKWQWKAVEVSVGFTHGFLACLVAHLASW